MVQEWLNAALVMEKAGYKGGTQMITKADIFSFAKNLARNFILPAIGKSTLYAILGGMVFFITGLLVYNFSLGLLLAGTHIVIRLLGMLVIVVIYTALGALIGIALGATSIVSKKLPAAEQGVQQMLTPVMGGIIEKIPVGQVGIPIEQFNNMVDGKISEFIKVPEQRTGLFSVLNFAARIVMKKLLAITRTVLVVNFVQDLQASGETQVTTHAVEKFARESLMRLVTNYARLKLYAVRKIAWAASGVLMSIPIILILINLVRG